MCICQQCHKEYKVDLIIPNSLWEIIKPSGKQEGSGLLCGSCIMNNVENLSQGYDAWRMFPVSKIKLAYLELIDDE